MSRAMPGLLTQRRADGVEERVLLRQHMTTLGRSDSCVVVIPFPNVSRLHARIEIQHDCYVLSDAGSANGTFVNGERITQSHMLSTGDVIWLGSPDVLLRFVDPEETLVAQPGVGAAALFIDENAHMVSVYGIATQLSPLEYGLLAYMAHNRGLVCTREACFRAVWGQLYDQATCEDAFNACVTKLRRNLRRAAATVGREPPRIATIQRVGFRLDADVLFAPGVERSAVERV